MSNKKLGVALVGLGSYATGQLAPALQQTKHCYLAGIVTGTPSKIPLWKDKYNIPGTNIYNYNNFDTIKDNPDIDIVYVVLPNSMHAEYTIRAAQAGKHVICEKPMALTVEDCDAMIAACKKAGKFLSIGYRLHFDPYHLDMIRMGTQKEYGEIKKIVTEFLQPSIKGEWRLDKKYSGGGPLMDLGIYCMQAVMYITGMEPVAVTAQTFPVSDKEKFTDIEETLDWQMEMPNGMIAACRTSYSGSANTIRAEAEKGWFELDPAFYYAGLRGSTADGKVISYPPLSQQAKQMDGIALSVKNNKNSIVPGEMGRKDVKIITAIYEAMRTGKRVSIKTD
ncbi:Gfo/Idh/MocA family protein [Ferruginibacter sp.]|nr:Gfo/Idh/MocA family oxidoreductase [Ferruginibacter sp.]